MNKLVIADDEKKVRNRVISIIESAHIPISEIIECDNGEKALDIIKNEEIDVLITDVNMPQLDGIMLAREIKKLGCNTKIIVISWYNDFDYAVNLLRSGVREYLLKPINKDDMINIMRLLQNELNDEKKEYKDNVNLLYDQIKHAFYHRDFYGDSINKTIIKLKHKVKETNYVIICTNYKQEKNISDNEFFFDSISGHNIIMTNPKNVNELLEGKLKGYGVGVSKVYNDLNLVYLASKEAIGKRKDNYFIRLNNPNCIREEKATKVCEIDNIIQLIGTARLETACKYFAILVNMVKCCEIEIPQFEGIVTEILNKIQSNYGGIIEEKNLNIKELLNIYKCTNIDTYSNELFKLVKIINIKITNECEKYKIKIKMEEAIKYIDENYKNEINMTMVSNYVSMNYSVFSLDFKEYTGKNFVNYLKDIRLQEAKRLLDETDMKIIEIGEAIGYENDKHFLKVFKGAYSVTSSEYRKNIKNGRMIVTL